MLVMNYNLIKIYSLIHMLNVIKTIELYNLKYIIFYNTFIYYKNT